MIYKTLIFGIEDGIARITINRPAQMNAIDVLTAKELLLAARQCSTDSTVRCVVLTGAGDRAFSAGNDLKAQAAGKRTGFVRSGFAGITHRFDLDKPLIAAVNGIAMGGGFEIALSCDIIVAAENAVFALPEPRVGLIAGAGGVHRLPRIIPQKQALGMILTGRRVSAVEGKELGFVNEVVPPGQALSAAKRWAELILQCSPKAIRASKQSYFRGLEEPNLEAAMRKIYPAHQENKESLDYIEGPKAFAEKRKPDWQNK